MEEQVQNLTSGVGSTFNEFLEREIFSFGKYSLSVDELLVAATILIAGMIISKLVKKIIYRSDKIDIAKQFALSQISQYVIIIITIFIALNALGIGDSLLLSSSALLVGVGIGLQNLFLDFVSGVIILLDRSIKVGDIIQISGIIGKVEEIKMRTTTLKTRENKNMIFPNSSLTKGDIINFSHNDDLVRFVVSVGVHYDSDVELVEKIMLDVAEQHIEVDKKKKPFVWFEDFGDSSLNYSLYYYSKSLFTAPRVRNEIRKEMLRKFRENGVTIPYPIRTLDFPKGSQPQSQP